MAGIDPWKTRSNEEEADDLFIEEDGDEETNAKRKEAQDELKNAGMLLVSGEEWKGKIKETLIEAREDESRTAPAWDNTICESAEKASKATCLVRRVKDSDGRMEYYKTIGDKERLEKTKKGKGGTGTGFLMFPRSKFGWLVITNNHVIMDEEEAESASVIFDHFDDESLPDKTKWFKVKQLVSKDIRTEGAKDFESLDFSVLALESDEIESDYNLSESEGTKFLRERAVTFEERETNKILRDKAFLKWRGLKFVPMIAFSHPHGLGKRISIGKYPNECEPTPETHIRHDLPTRRGSSGANLMYLDPLSDDRSVSWNAAFLHYRHGHAVAWRAIGPVLRKDYVTYAEGNDSPDSAVLHPHQ